MRKIIIIFIFACLPVHSYAILPSCTRSYATCPIDPTQDTYNVWNGISKSYDTVFNGSPNIQLPFAFATEDYKHLLKVNNYFCYVCGGKDFHCESQDIVSIINKDGRIVDFYGCLLDHSISTDLGFYKPSSSGWRRIDDKINNIKQCPKSNLFPIIDEPQKHGGKAYYLGSGDGKGYSYPDGNGVISLYALENNVCYYYYCDDGYEYVSSKKTCINTENRNKARETILELEEAKQQKKSINKRAKAQETINQLKAAFGLD